MITLVALGLGGAIFMDPFFLSVPPLPGVGQFDMKQVAAISIVVIIAVTGIKMWDQF